MKPYIFLGPSLPLEHARQHLDAVYLPPVAQGDVAALVASSSPSVIGIIDGFFEGVPPVWHKEILLALSKGIAVVGAASMGALRAAELHAFGMQGVGRIFEWYRDGLIDADDEVTLLHAPADLGYRPLSVPLVNMRATFRCAVNEGVISLATSQALIGAARQVFYADRSYPLLLSKAPSLGIASSEVDALRRFIAARAVDQKQLDAIEALQAIDALASARSGPEPERDVTSQEQSGSGFELQETIFLKDLLDRDYVVPTGSDCALTHEHLVNHARLAHPNFGRMRQELIDENIILRQASALGVRADDAELQSALDQFRRARGLLQRSELLSWLETHRLTLADLGEMLERQLLIQKTRSLFSRLEHRTVLDRLRMDGCYASIERATLETERRAEARSGLEPAPVSERALLQNYSKRLARTDKLELDSLVEELGFADRATLVVELEKYCEPCDSGP
jgi:hypothetical protein